VKRVDGRPYDELRPVKIIPGYQSFAEGSALIKLGKTHVLCSVSVEERVPPFLKGSGTGWITAEYAMLPRATVTRSQRDSTVGRVGGRNQEIQRLIGRSLRAVADLAALGERSLLVDCDVIQADGGTRTAAITGAYVALYKAMETLQNMGVISSIPLKSAVAATSVGIVNTNMMMDLCYDEDAQAAVDFIEQNHADPFFLYLAFNAVHAPMQETEKYLSRFSSITNELRRTHAAMLSAMNTSRRGVP
jgi:ribonuclease PH